MGHHARRPVLRRLGHAVVGARRRPGGDPERPAVDDGAAAAAGGAVLAVPGGAADGAGAGRDGAAMVGVGRGALTGRARSGLRRHWEFAVLLVIGGTVSAGIRS